MTAGVVLILGAAGINLGSGMTGGLAYILRDSLSDDSYHREFVRRTAVAEQEEGWLRQLLTEHMRLTGSPRAGALLRAGVGLHLWRLEPLCLPCSIPESWVATLARLEKREIADLDMGKGTSPSVTPVVVGPPAV